MYGNTKGEFCNLIQGPKGLKVAAIQGTISNDKDDENENATVSAYLMRTKNNLEEVKVVKN